MDTVDDVLQAINKGAVWIFILGNIFTGAINKLLEGKISTLDNTVSLPIIVTYLAVLVTFVLIFFPKAEDVRKDAGDGQSLEKDKKEQ